MRRVLLALALLFAVRADAQWTNNWVQAGVASASGAGTVTSVSTVTTGMGLTLVVANPTTTPQITLAGILLPAAGGFGADVSGSTGIALNTAGTFSFLGSSGSGNVARVTGPTITSLVPTFTDVTTGDWSASAHGLVPKLGLSVAGGGTSLTTWTAHGAVMGNGTSAPTFVAPGSNGNVLTSNGTDWTSAAASGGISGLTTGTYPKAASATTLADGLIFARTAGIGVGTLTTADALADNAIGATATTQKGLVLQGKASATANIFEVQKSDGTVMFAVQDSASGAGFAPLYSSGLAFKPTTNTVVMLGGITTYGGIKFFVNATDSGTFNRGTLQMSNVGAFAFSSTAASDVSTATLDTGIERCAAGVLCATDGKGNGSITTTAKALRFIAAGATPAVSNTTANSCGTSAASIAGNNQTGIVTVGATAGTSCTLTFADAAPTRRQCIADNESTGNLARATYTDTTHSNIIGTFAAGDVIAYQCSVY